MRGQTNAIKLPISINNSVKYSYDGIMWKNFGYDGYDIGHCAFYDKHTNILEIKASGYDLITQTTYYDDDKTFYLKIAQNCNIYYCIVGGGGGSSGGAKSGWGAEWSNLGGGGGAGGCVIYNITPYPCQGGQILKIQIGTGGDSGGGYWGENNPPKQGNSTFLIVNNGSTDIYTQEAVGGAGAANCYNVNVDYYDGANHAYTRGGTSNGGTGFDNSTDDICIKSSPGGAGTTSDNNNSSETLIGTQWPYNGIYYGGGGGGAGGHYYKRSYNQDTIYAGMLGGIGGGGAGGKNSGNWTNASAGYGQPGLENTGGGAGGADSGWGGGAQGGSGICLIKFE